MVGEIDDSEQQARAAFYRENARTLRRLAAEIRYDLGRKSQLIALAAGFDRYADRVEGSLLAVAD